MRRSVQPNCPRAMTCCFFVSLKMLAMPAEGPRSLPPRQRLERLLPMAVFQVSMYGRFWVSTEEWWPSLFADGGHDASRGALRGLHGAERGHEHAQLSMPLDAPEALGGAQQAEPDPPPPHVPVAPALDVPGDVPQGADQILDAIRRREEATQRRRQPQLQHRERFLQPLAHTGGGIGLTIPLQPRGQRRQLPPGRRRAGRPIRPAQARPDVGLARCRDEGVEVARLVELAALNDGGVAEDNRP